MKIIIRYHLLILLLSMGISASTFAQTGRVFYDINNNQVQENDEPGFANLSVKVFQRGKELKVENCLAVIKTNSTGDFVLPNNLPNDLRILITENKDYCSEKSPKSMTYCLIADVLVSSSTSPILISHNPAYRRGVNN